MGRLKVFLNGELTGVLDLRKDNYMGFTYEESRLSKNTALPLSRSLPLQEGRFNHKQARPFFAGVLPEGDPRASVAALLGISEENDFELLSSLGGDCAGAVTLLPEDETPQLIDARIRHLEDAELAKIVQDLPNRPFLADEEGIRLSLAGAQGKLPVVCSGDSIGLPLGNTPSTHIIKPEPTRFPGLVANEAFCMRLAKAVGLEVPEVRVIHAGDTPCLLVERYDRSVNKENQSVRIHQEDFCQALGIIPEKKYQKEGGPSLQDSVRLIRVWSSAPVFDVPRFVDAVIFNALIGNADAHGKNYSFLYTDDGKRRLAPSYDLVCTLAWSQLTKGLAMRIGSAEYVTEVTTRHIEQFAEKNNLGKGLVRDRISRIVGTASTIIDRLSDANQDEPVIQKMREILHNRIKHLQ